MKTTYRVLGLKYKMYSMTITEICFFMQFSLAAMKKIVVARCMFYVDWYLKGATFANNNSTPFHLSHIYLRNNETQQKEM